MSDKIYSIEEISSLLNKMLKNRPVKKVTLFGSYAKNKASKNSDIDLVIDTNNSLKGFKFIGLICEIEDYLNKKVDGFEQSEIIENSKIDNEIKKTGVVVYEK